MDLKTNFTGKITELFNRNPKWKEIANNLLDHGLGYMSKSEHDYLVKEKSINCDGEVDMINCDYPKLEIKGKYGDYEHIDLNGNYNLLKQEQANNKGSRIVFFPRKYYEYIENKNKNWKQVERESMNDLVEKEHSFEEIATLFT